MPMVPSQSGLRAPFFLSSITNSKTRRLAKPLSREKGSDPIRVLRTLKVDFTRSFLDLDNWGDPQLPVPHGTPCNRLEGRIDTGARKPEAKTCDTGAFPQKLKVTHRRYVIDETLGAVSILHNFPWLDAGIPVDRAPRSARCSASRAARPATSTR